MNKKKRVATQVHTRKLDRMIAHKNMSKYGFSKVNKNKAAGSYFAKQWRKYIIA